MLYKNPGINLTIYKWYTAENKENFSRTIFKLSKVETKYIYEWFISYFEITF